MMSTSPSFWDALLAQSPQIMGALSQSMGDPQLQFAANQSNNLSRFQRSQNGQNPSSLITNGTGEQTPGQSQPANMTTQPTKPMPPTQMNTGPSRTVMGTGGGMDSGSRTQFGGRNFSDGQFPSALTYRMGTGGYRNFMPVDANQGNNLWQTYNRMAGMSPNGNNLIY